MPAGSAENVVRTLVNAADADIYVFSAAITNAFADTLIEQVRQVENRRPNAILALVTDGGSPDAAYRIARCIKRHYTRFTLHVYGACYSAGTLIAVGSDDIVMSEFGQLGPLDVQLADKTELFGQTAALDVSQALVTLSGSAFTFFTEHFFNMGPGRGISTQTASDIAKTLTLGIIEPIAKQIDPLLLGRVDRSMKIAEAYAGRLNPRFRNIKRLVEEYPSHEFVIDFDEAQTLFERVRQPDANECAFESMLRLLQCAPNQHASSFVERLELSLPPVTAANEPNQPPHDESTHSDSAPRNGSSAPASQDHDPTNSNPVAQPSLERH